MTTNDDREDNSEDNHQGEEDRAGDEDEDQPDAQMTQHRGKRQEDDNNDKDLHHRMNEWLGDEHGDGTAARGRGTGSGKFSLMFLSCFSSFN